MSKETSIQQMRKPGESADAFRNRSNEDIALEYGKRGLGGALPIKPWSDEEAKAVGKGSGVNISVGGGEEGEVVTPIRDASDNFKIKLPSQSLVINGSAFAAGLMDAYQRDSSKG